MAAPKPRLYELSDSQREELLTRSRDLWKIVCGSLGVMEARGRDHDALADFAPELGAFAYAISEGRVNLGEQLATAHAKAELLEDDADRYERDVEAAIAMCGGDERATIKSLLVLTEFLELEAFGAEGAQYRRK
ncbi:hypothetical protein GCM10011390_48640 [Aureimonas endophytica]|uniref:Uncharacterized protein n=1 Tax=Aureimonas endophytica TaxID=2027858 RepID=A0A917ED03_9HYPH|nr:hypothetical protein [Aureimonas endophytica]GGE23492.1 hypothetical protein GCM10011390_48640 [Aureimonas endophytica]